MAIAFTGLATTTEFNTSDLILNTVASIGNAKPHIHDILWELKEVLSGHRLFSQGNHRLTILASGYVYYDDRPRLCSYTLSNFAARLSPSGEFDLRMSAPQDSIIALTEGTDHAVSVDTINRLRGLLESDLDTRRVLRFAIKHMQLAARDGRSAGLVGEQINSVIIPSQPDTTVSATYHSAKPLRRYFWPNIVVAGKMRIDNQVTMTETTLTGPETRKRDSCWCGSGLEFRKCHMIKYGAALIHNGAFRRPLSPFFELNCETRRASGTKFIVSSGYS